MAHQKAENTAKFERKLNRITNHLILNTPFPEIALSKMDPFLRGNNKETLITQPLSGSFPCRRESTKKIINSGKPGIPAAPWLNDP